MNPGSRVFSSDSERPVGRVLKNKPLSPRGEVLVETGWLRPRVRRVPPPAVVSRQVRGVRLKLSRAEFMALPGYVPDDELRTAVYESMRRFAPLAYFAVRWIEVTVRDGDVVLTGYVPTDVLRREAEAEALSTWSVLSVENRLVADRELEMAVTRAFLAYPELQPSLVRVSADLGRVILEGELPSESLAALAQSVAGQVPGVAEVESRLQVVAPPPPGASTKLAA